MKYILIFILNFIIIFQSYSDELMPLAAFKIDSLWYIIDHNGNTIMNPLKLNNVQSYSEGFYIVEMDIEGKKRLGFMTNEGQVAITEFDEVRPFKMGMAVVGRDRELAKDSVIRYFGYINNKGELKVKLKYLEAYDFSDSLAWVMNYDERGYIDHSGKIKIEYIQNGFGNNFFQGKASFSDSTGTFGFINKEGKLIFGMNWDDAGNFVEDRAKVNKLGMYGYIDTNGLLVIKHAYDFANDFANGYAFVGIPGESMYKPLWSIINKSGVRMFDFKYEDVRDFSEGIATVMLGKKWKYIDPQDNQIIKGEFDVAESFHNGLAYVYSEEWKINGFISPMGELIIPIPKEASEIIDLRINKKVK